MILNQPATFTYIYLFLYLSTALLISKLIYYETGFITIFMILHFVTGQ